MIYCSGLMAKTAHLRSGDGLETKFIVSKPHTTVYAFKQLNVWKDSNKLVRLTSV